MGVMPYEQFEKIIGAIQDNYNKLDGIGEALNWDGAFDLSMSSTVLDLLAYIFHDESEWIAYWIYERDFGRDWYEGCVTDEDGKNIDMSTVRKLYDYLVANMPKQ